MTTKVYFSYLPKYPELKCGKPRGSFNCECSSPICLTIDEKETTWGLTAALFGILNYIYIKNIKY